MDSVTCSAAERRLLSKRLATTTSSDHRYTAQKISTKHTRYQLVMHNIVYILQRHALKDEKIKSHRYSPSVCIRKYFKRFKIIRVHSMQTIKNYALNILNTIKMY